MIGNPVIYEPTPEERAAEKSRLASWAKIEADAKRAREQAEKRAEQLLINLLSEQQRRDLKRHGAFFIQGRVHRYRVRRGRYGNVDVIAAMVG